MANTDQKNLRCDQRHLQPLPAWYRFAGAAGDKMPTSCVPKRRCGTHAPGWLNGSHPTVREGIVTRPVCYHWGSRCCNWKNDIQVQNCGAFYVYRLVKPPVCWLRYCGDNEGELSFFLLTVFGTTSSSLLKLSSNMQLLKVHHTRNGPNSG